VAGLIVTCATYALAHIPNCSERGGVWISDLNADGSGACVSYDADHQIHEVRE